MTIGEIKKEALKIMFTNQDNTIDDNTISELKTDSSFGDYLNNMNGSINRAIVRLKSKGVSYLGYKLAEEEEYTKTRLDSSIDDNNVLGIDEELSELIPYFIKGELYEEDKPQEAVLAMNYFEDAVDEYLSSNISNVINLVYEMDVK